MMGYQSYFQHKLFVVGFNLEKCIRKNHILRKILEKIELNSNNKCNSENHAACVMTA